jgi:hypothetical protein
MIETNTHSPIVQTMIDLIMTEKKESFTKEEYSRLIDKHFLDAVYEMGVMVTRAHPDPFALLGRMVCILVEGMSEGHTALPTRELQ